jgi:hypothetical protein
MTNKDARKKRKRKKLLNHVEWLYTMHKAGVEIDPAKIQGKQIVDRLVSKASK